MVKNGPYLYITKEEYYFSMLTALDVYELADDDAINHVAEIDHDRRNCYKQLKAECHLSDNAISKKRLENLLSPQRFRAEISY